MRVWKPKYKDKKTGEQKEVSKWWIELRDHQRTIRRFPALPDKTMSEALGRRIEQLVSCKISRQPPDPELTRWLEGLPRKMCERFVEVGLLDAQRGAATKPLIEHLADFEKSLFINAAKRSVEQRRLHVSRIIEGCKFKYWSDVKGSEIERYLAERRKTGISKKTAHEYASSFRQFSLWMVREKRASEAPVIHTEKVPRHFERAFEIDEFQNLLEATRSGPVRLKLTGYERYLLYLLAVETGLRRNELRSLTPASFDFKNCLVYVKGDDTKNDNDAVQPIKPTTAKLFEEFISGNKPSTLFEKHASSKLPGVHLFPNINNHTAKMIQADCRAAGIEVENHKGKIKFHSLRHTCSSFLAASGVHPKVAQEIMRHSDINLTMSRYTHTLTGQKAAAIDKMPDFGKPKEEGKETA